MYTNILYRNISTDYAHFIMINAYEDDVFISQHITIQSKIYMLELTRSACPGAVRKGKKKLYKLKFSIICDFCPNLSHPGAWEGCLKIQSIRTSKI